MKIALVLAMLLVPRMALADPRLPQIECTYYRTTDRIVQLYVTNSYAMHLDEATESNIPRVISPQAFLLDRGNPLGRCDVWRSGDEIDLPLTQPQMWAFHLQYLAREAKELPVHP